MADFLKAVVGGIGNLLGGLLPGNRLTYGNTSVLNCVGHFWFLV